MMTESKDLSKREYMTLDTAIEHAGFGRAQLKYLAAACVVFFTEVQLIVSGGLTLPSVKCEWNLEKWQILLMLVSGSLFSTLSGIVGGFLSDTYGRRNNVIFGQLFMVLFTGLSIMQSDFYWFTAARAISHFFFMVIKPSALCMVLEICPRGKRFYVKMALAVSGQLGAVGSAVVAMKYLNPLGWRAIVMMLTVPCLIPLLIYSFLEESPRFLFVSGRVEEGTCVMRGIFKDNNKSDVSNLIKNRKERSRGRIKDMFTPEFKQLSYIMITIFVLKNGVISTLHTAMPFILQSGYCAQQQSQLLPKQVPCHSLSREHLVSLAQGCLAGVFVICGGLGLSQLTGRKVAAMCCCFGTAAALLANTFCHGSQLLVLKISAALSLHHAAIAILTLFIQEVYPTSIRALTSGFFFAAGHVVSTLAPYLTVYVVAGHELEMFAVGGLVFGICGVLLGRVQQETLNQPLRESTSNYVAIESDQDWGLELDYDD